MLATTLAQNTTSQIATALSVILAQKYSDIEVIDCAGCKDKNIIISNLNVLSLGANRLQAIRRFFVYLIKLYLKACVRTLLSLKNYIF